ncbi:hypothetical protein HPP92_009595 [Vanilla planifolia]|nr:hypothetical protein HPP92_009595 [Vanilla planifolia]
MEDKEQARPLAFGSPNVYGVATPAGGDQESGQMPRKRVCNRCCAFWCCGCCSATVIILGVTILVLALTVFQIKDPTVTMNGLHVDHLFVPGIGSFDNPVSVNATLTADISVKNPNVASLRFQNSTTDFYYNGSTVGVAYAPEGYVRRYRTARMNVTVDVLTDRVVLETNGTASAIIDGGLNMSSYTDIAGRVNVLGIYKQNLDIQLNCTFILDVLESTITNRVCHTTVR